MLAIAIASLDVAMTYDVSVIGLGRVGLPLALGFADRGLRVLGVDNDPERLAAVRDGRMPFEETGADELLDARAPSIDAVATAPPTPPQADAIVITLGTPSFSHIEIDMRDIRSALDDLLPRLREGTRSCCARRSRPARPSSSPATWRSTAASQVGEDIFVAHAPERIAAGRFLEEIGTLPCIVGGVGERSGEAAGELFEPLGAPIVQTTPVQAELAKIWTNILRYATFALPNLLMMDCEQYGANVFEVIDLINRDYPRGGMPQPGFTAGTCLRKDFAFSRGALARAGDAAGRLARQRVGAAVPRRGHQAPARARCAGARSRCSAWRSRPTPTTSATRCRTS